MGNSIYKYTNIINGKVYVGYSCDPERRYREHISDANAGSNTPFHRAIRKYGMAGFEFEIIMTGISTIDKMCEKETEFIKLLESNKFGYNCDLGGKRTLRNYGERNKSKITEEQAMIIINDPRSHSELSTESGISISIISDVRCGKSWKYLNRDAAPKYNDSRNVVSEETAMNIILDPCPNVVAAKKYDTTDITVHDIRKCKTWKHLSRDHAPKYKSKKTKISEETAINIINDPIPHCVATVKYGTDVRNIRYGKTWKHLDRSSAPIYQSVRK